MSNEWIRGVSAFVGHNHIRHRRDFRLISLGEFSKLQLVLWLVDASVLKAVFSWKWSRIKSLWRNRTGQIKLAIGGKKIYFRKFNSFIFRFRLFRFLCRQVYRNWRIFHQSKPLSINWPRNRYRNTQWRIQIWILLRSSTNKRSLPSVFLEHSISR